MKKLMFAAAVAVAAVAAQAGCELPTPATVCAYPVWDFQMMLRADTLCRTTGYVAASQAHCGIGGGQEVCGCYRELQTLSYSGAWYICDCGCDKLSGQILVPFADMTRKIAYGNGVVASTEFYRFGSYAGKVAFLADLQFGNASKLQLAGFGVYPLGQAYPQAIAGYATGVIDASANCYGNNFCGIWALCEDDSTAPITISASDPSTWPAPDETKATAVAYGQFQTKFNAAAAARFNAAGGDLTTIMPAWYINAPKVPSTL